MATLTRPLMGRIEYEQVNRYERVNRWVGGPILTVNQSKLAEFLEHTEIEFDLIRVGLVHLTGGDYAVCLARYRWVTVGCEMRPQLIDWPAAERLPRGRFVR